jgi:hypothetical protein
MTSPFKLSYTASALAETTSLRGVTWVPLIEVRSIGYAGRDNNLSRQALGHQNALL